MDVLRKIGRYDILGTTMLTLAVDKRMDDGLPAGKAGAISAGNLRAGANTPTVAGAASQI